MKDKNPFDQIVKLPLPAVYGDDQAQKNAFEISCTEAPDLEIGEGTVIKGFFRSDKDDSEA